MKIATLYKIKLKQEKNKLSKIEDPIYLYKYALNTKNIEILNFIIDKLTKLKSIHFLFLCASDIENINISKIEDSIISLGGYKYLPDFASYIKGTNITKIEDALINYGNVEYIINFINNVKEANKEKIQNYIIESNDPKKIYTFIRETKYNDIIKTSVNNQYLNIAVETNLISGHDQFKIIEYDIKPPETNKQKTLKKT